MRFFQHLRMLQYFVIFLPREVCFRLSQVVCLKGAPVICVMKSIRSIPTRYLPLNGCARRLTMPSVRVLSASQAENTTLFLPKSKNLNPCCFRLGKCKYNENEKLTILTREDYLGY